jgi:hypothetical protein
VTFCSQCVTGLRHAPEYCSSRSNPSFAPSEYQRDRPVFTSSSMSEDHRAPQEPAVYPIPVHLRPCPVLAGH